MSISGSITQAHAEAGDLTKLSLEDLLSTEVTSVAKKPQRVDEAAAAVFVIDQEDIRRSGATTIPDLLRMVPGLEVGALTSGAFAVSARGFNGRSSNKLLVLVDGRAIYLSALSGVFWDQQLVPVEDIQRIEVVRGPGAALWGANAVNGVINIVTKHAVDTLGAAATAQAGTDNDRRFDARYGFQLGEAGALRLYATGVDRHDMAQLGSVIVANPSRGIQGGFRVDVDPNEQDALTLQGDLNSGSYHFNQSPLFNPATLPLPANGGYSGADVLGRWSRTWDAQTGMALQAYWDHVHRSDEGLNGSADQLDLDLSGHFQATPRQALIWGAGFRQTSDHVLGQSFLFLSPDHRRDNWYGAYGEDDIALTSRLNLSIGAKIEHNDYSGFEFQPSIRAIWRSPQGWSVWGAISRAVRTPSRFEEDLTLFTSALELLPGALGSEKLTAYEIGWRGQLWSGAALDVAGYHQVYKDLIAETVTGFIPPSGPAITRFGNSASAHNTGVEVALNDRLTPNWTVKASGSWQSLKIPTPGLLNAVSGSVVDAAASPATQFSLRSQWNVTDDVDFDVWIRRVGQLDAGAVKAYTDLDLRLAWRPTAHIEVSVSGFNLLSRERVEFRDPTEPLTAVIQRRGQISLGVRY